jgi:D-alanyl-D-alanine carboxypeptidase (penicillin-binding protein 5/6)
MPDPRRIFSITSAVLATNHFFNLPRASAQDAASYAVVDNSSGHILISHNASKRVEIGSLTNIATAMVVLDWLEVNKHDLSEMVTIPGEATQYPDNPIGFQPGDQVSIRDLLYASLMQSDDIATYSLALRVGRDLPTSAADETPMQAFVAQMNALARKLQMHGTLFVDATGLELNERRLPYSSATDLALLTRYAMNRSQFRFYVSQKARQISVSHTYGVPTGYQLANTNDLLDTDAIDGVRTGTNHRTGPCVIISAAKAPESVQQGEQYIITPRRLIVVVLGSDRRFDLAHQLLVSGWQTYDQWAAAGRPMRGS